MTSSMPNDVEALSNKIVAALPLFNDCKSDTRPKDECNSKYLSYQEMFKTYMNELAKNPNKFQDNEEFTRISPEFPFHHLIVKSKVLEDQKLFEAVLYCKVFRDEAEFRANYKYEGELIWITSPEIRVFVFLVSQNQIIYDIGKTNLFSIRQNMQKTWAVFKEKVEKNLIEAFCGPESIRERSNVPSTSTANHIRHPMTDEMKKLMLDELDNLNLDIRVKQLFVFDLKVLPDKDVNYWRGRLDSLRLCSNIAVISSPELEWERICQVVLANRKKRTDCNKAILASTAEQVKSEDTVDHRFRSQELLEFEKIVGNFTTEADSLIERLTNLKEKVTRPETVWKISEMEAKALKDSVMPQLRKLNETFDSISRAG